ncbi:acyl-CoA thioesterase [Chachezhania antarctica]|uniref:acyl-CoA thioesterase n=1 Tax=Chachezhania antarctica TaxID=2340860 RepID=UPI000EAEC2CE|nr:acyl-CoA thioesterase II [Chachezhania antarctica]
MDDTQPGLLDLLGVEQLELDLFRGIGGGGETPNRIFGGQVIGQALAAACRTVSDRMCHSLHAYFIRPGDPSIPVIYEVDRARDGGSFTTRRVVAIQHGKQILNLSASYHVAEEGWDYQHAMPDVARPETLPALAETRAELAHRVHEDYRAEFIRPRPYDMREVEPRDLLNPEPSDDLNHVWIRAEEAAEADPVMQQLMLTYLSDLQLLGTSLRPHGLTWMRRNVMTASLDHAMWFHAPVRLQDWHLYVMDAPFTGKGRGLNRGSIYHKDGTLVATVMQEGLVRPVKKKT